MPKKRTTVSALLDTLRAEANVVPSTPIDVKELFDTDTDAIVADKDITTIITDILAKWGKDK